MSRDGSGNYTRVPGSAYTNGTTADGSEIDAEINDIAAALTQSIAKDGQTVPTANLPMGGYKHTNVNTASARTEYARASQVQDGSLTYLSSVSGADAITASAPVGLSAYAAGQEFRFVAAGDNTGAVTLNINGLGAKNVVGRDGAALVAGNILSDEIVVVRYDGTEFQIYTPEVFDGQLAFPATQNPSSDVNTLDDYEEGTFTPTVVSSGGGTPTYATQVGRYTKVGNRVQFVINVQLATFGTLAAGDITISGLPFTSNSTSGNRPPLSVVCSGLDAAVTTPPVADILENTTAARLLIFSGGSLSALTRAGLSSVASIRVAGHFEV